MKQNLAKLVNKESVLKALQNFEEEIFLLKTNYQCE